MDNQTTLIIIGVALFALGLGIGVLIGRRLSPQASKNREVERRLDTLLQEHQAYQHEVTEHFGDTARLLNNLTRSYRDVHQHLAKGAASLCDGDGPLALSGQADAKDDSEIPEELADVQPPLDYAPKSSPEETGMLNEKFGLDQAKKAAAASETS